VVTVYSHSRLSSFENCPKQFQFRYVLKIPSETEGIEAFVGKRVHEILERLYEFVDQGRIPPLEKVVERFHTIFDEHYDSQRVRIVKEGLDVNFYRELGVRCIHNYYRRHYPFDANETLGIEERVLFELDPAGEYKMQGIIDRIARARDGTVEIIDYKTGQWVPGQKRLDEDRQLALYQLGLRKVYGPDQPMRLVWHYVARGVTVTSERTPEQLDAMRQQTILRIDEIVRETAYEPKKSKLCSWCEYRGICPLFKAEADGATLPEAKAKPRSTAPLPPKGAQLPLL
jgi:putative RecB family exonuclease